MLRTRKVGLRHLLILVFLLLLGILALDVFKTVEKDIQNQIYRRWLEVTLNRKVESQEQLLYKYKYKYKYKIQIQIQEGKATLGHKVESQEQLPFLS